MVAPVCFTLWTLRDKNAQRRSPLRFQRLLLQTGNYRFGHRVVAETNSTIPAFLPNNLANQQRAALHQLQGGALRKTNFVKNQPDRQNRAIERVDYLRKANTPTDNY